MNREDIIRMAREAGIPFNKWGLIGCLSCEVDIDENLERFAALVAAAERERCAKVCLEIKQSEPLSDRIGWEHGTVDCAAATDIANEAIDALRAALAQQAEPVQEPVASNDLEREALSRIKLPCDVRIGHGTHGKGTSVWSLVSRARALYQMALDYSARQQSELQKLRPLATQQAEPAQKPVANGSMCRWRGRNE